MGRFIEPNSISARAGAAVPSGKRFGKSAQKYQWVLRNVYIDFRYEETEYEVSFGLASPERRDIAFRS